MLGEIIYRKIVIFRILIIYRNFKADVVGFTVTFMCYIKPFHKEVQTGHSASTPFSYIYTFNNPYFPTSMLSNLPYTKQGFHV